MHSAQKPTYAERDDYSRIRLCLDGVLQSPFKATGGLRAAFEAES
jgi:hypothetical protein